MWKYLVCAMIAVFGSWVALAEQVSVPTPAATQRAQREFPAASPATVPQGADVNAKPAQPSTQPAISPSRLFADLTFSRDYDAGTKDARGQGMGGTETMRLLRHQGKLFASTGVWMDLPYGLRPEGQPAWTGPQILVKESAAAPWQVDDVRLDACLR